MPCLNSIILVCRCRITIRLGNLMQSFCYGDKLLRQQVFGQYNGIT